MPLKIAMLGTGRIADVELAPALTERSGACLWSVLSRDGDRAQDFATRHRARAPRAAYSDLDALLADPELDAVLIATPDRLHAAQAIAAARAGKHVFTEKPMATEKNEAWAMVRACAEQDVRLGVGYHMRWHAGHRALAAAAHAGRFGELRHMRVQWARRQDSDSNWRAHPQVGRWWSLAGVGTHCLDQVRWFMAPSCGEITQVSSVISNAVWGSPHDETAVLALKFENGATAAICASVLFDAPRRMEVYGTAGYALCEGTLGPKGDGAIVTSDGVTSDGVTSDGTFDFTPVNPYVAEIADFAAAVRDRRDPEVAGAEGARNVEILLEAVGAG